MLASFWKLAMTIQLGAVSYWNAKPLIYGLDREPHLRLQLAAPSRLADLLRAGELDAGLIPVAAAFTHDDYEIMHSTCIASDGPVASVLVVLLQPLARARVIGLDTASRTSRLLAQIILRRRIDTALTFIDFNVQQDQGRVPVDAFLVIGDAALAFRGAATVMDLGEEWRRLTGLPFVYAGWLARRNAKLAGLVAHLQQAYRDGAAHLDDILAPLPAAARPAMREYLTRHIQYEFTPRHREGLAEFHRLALADGLLTAPAGSPRA